MIPALLFYLFSGVLVLASLMVIASRNPVHSVLFLILAFFNAAGLFLLLGAEFVAFILVIVYVGAVAVLFLFVVMMLDINFRDLRKGVWKSLPVGLLVGVVLVAQLVITAANWQSLPNVGKNVANAVPQVERQADGQVSSIDYGAKGVKIEAHIMGDAKPDVLKPLADNIRSNTQQIGDVLYTDYVYPFQVAGLILLVAMIGAITLTLRDRGGVRKQDINAQITRKQADAMQVRKVEKGAGIS